MLPSLMTRSSLARRLVLLPILLPIQSLAEPAFELPDGLVLFDETVPIVLSGLDPGRIVTIRLEQHDSAGLWRSHGIFVADAEGRVDVSRSAPLAGTYSGVAPMGLIWSVERDPTVEPRPAAPEPDLTPVVSRLSAEIDGETVATGMLARYPVAPDVAVTEVREGGLVGVYYRPAGVGPFPSMLAMGGSGGGVLPPVQYPGGLVSRGYAVLALAYFGIEGRPAQLQMLPIEYFKSGLDWLAARSEVDAERIGVFGSSRGGELVLLLGATYPEIAAVVAHVPSHVLWEGCCDAVAVGEPAWTYQGSVLPHIQTPVPADRMVFPDDLIFPLDDAAAVERAAIPVERINGAVLLISGQDDTVWASSYMAGQVVERLRRYDFQHPVIHLSYEDAGHAIGRPHYRMFPVFGGTPRGNARARADHWERMLEFLDENLAIASRP